MMKNLLSILFLLFSQTAKTQTDTILFSKVSGFEFEHPFLPYSAFTSIFEQSGEPYIYAACRDLGLVTFDISDINSPVPVDTIATWAFATLKPTNLSQHENYLYVSLGGFDGLVPQKAGLAILDISNAAHPVIKDQWDSTAFTQGAAIAISDGEYVYLGAMDEGVIILDVSDKSNIRFLASILPDPNFPEVPGLFSVPNARGLALYGGDKLMVAYDAGGLRMIDITDKENPVEIGKYVNTDIEDIAQSAYNNIAIVDHYAYVPVDMCGLDVIDISSAEMETVYWYNPWDCDSSNWVGRPGHTNEVKVRGDSLLYISGGDSEVLAFDITDRENPVLVGQYVHVSDSIVTWAIDISENYVSLALINNEIFGIPYYSNVGGIHILEMDIVAYVDIEEGQQEQQTFSIFPNPAGEWLCISSASGYQYVKFISVTGTTVSTYPYAESYDISMLPAGVYFLHLYRGEEEFLEAGQFVKNK